MREWHSFSIQGSIHHLVTWTCIVKIENWDDSRAHSTWYSNAQSHPHKHIEGKEGVMRESTSLHSL